MLTSDIINIIKTNDDKGMFINFMHDDGERIIVAKELKENDDTKVDSIKDTIIELKELKRALLIRKKEKVEKGFVKKLFR